MTRHGAVNAAARRSVPRWWKSVVVGGIITSVALGGQWLLHRPFFSVQLVSVTGAIHESPAQVVAVSRLSTKVAMINVDEAAVAARLTRLPWVFSVTVSRHWPHSVSIAITERHPVAIAVRGDNYDLVANDGTDLGVAPVGTDLPRLVTAAGGWPFTGSQNDLVVVAGSLPRAFSAQVARISQEPNSGIRLEMTTPVTFILGPASNLTAKYQDVAAVLAHEHLAAGDVVDVTVPTAVAISGP